MNQTNETLYINVSNEYEGINSTNEQFTYNNFILSKISNEEKTINGYFGLFSIGRYAGKWIFPGTNANFTVKLKKNYPIEGFTFSIDNSTSCRPKRFSLFSDEKQYIPSTFLNDDVQNVTINFKNSIKTKNIILSVDDNNGDISVCLNQLYVLPYSPNPKKVMHV